MDLLRRVTCVTVALSALAGVGTAQAAPAHTLVPKDWAKSHRVGVKQGALDRDKDGLTNWGEYRAGTDPLRRDSDKDGVSDALENRDGDGLVNADEVAAGTDPRKRDSDGDRIPDGREDRDRDGLLNADERTTGHDLLKRDTDADGMVDGLDNAGKVTAVSVTSVTIRLFTGGTLTATLSADSWIDCTTTAAAPVVATGSGAGGGSTDTTKPGGSGSTGGSGGIGEPDSSEGSSGTDPAPDIDPSSGDDPAPDSDPEPVEEDPARSAFLLRQSAPAQLPPEDDSSEDWDPAGEDSIGPPDLGACATALRVGAIVHRAGVDGTTLSDLELMKPVAAPKR